MFRAKGADRQADKVTREAQGPLWRGGCCWFHRPSMQRERVLTLSLALSVAAVNIDGDGFRG